MFEYFENSLCLIDKMTIFFIQDDDCNDDDYVPHGNKRKKIIILLKNKIKKKRRNIHEQLTCVFFSAFSKGGESSSNFISFTSSVASQTPLFVSQIQITL